MGTALPSPWTFTRSLAPLTSTNMSPLPRSDPEERSTVDAFATAQGVQDGDGEERRCGHAGGAEVAAHREMERMGVEEVVGVGGPPRRRREQALGVVELPAQQRQELA